MVVSDVQAVTVNVADVVEITYDNVTLDFDAVGDVNSDWAFWWRVCFTDDL